MRSAFLGSALLAVVLLGVYGMLRLMNAPRGTFSYYQRRFLFVAGMVFLLLTIFFGVGSVL